MDVAPGSTGNGAKVQLADCDGDPAQQFRLNDAHDLANRQADKCVDVTDVQTADGTGLQIWDCT
ncbi:RICIN domain-containing protein [Streptomyces sp. NPDC048252]|uniref:RICIN domain-containing protein n=1 Tax=Streptomyces sp. NPDC048252 TaxID=3154612 RepID=UPI00343E6079